MKNSFYVKSGILILSSFVLFACSKKNVSLPETASEKIISTHTWYYINATSFDKIDAPQNAPKVIEKPYTESIRIAGIGQTCKQTQDSANQDISKAYALVNHLGIIELDGENATIHSDKFIFDDFTASEIVFMNNNPVFSLYKDSFFNESLSADSKAQNSLQKKSVLVQYEPNAKIFFPILNTQSLNLAPQAQVADFYWDGTFWYYCIKNSTENKTDFSYIKWKPETALLDIFPNDLKIDEETNIDKKTKVSILNSSENEFRKMKEIKNFSESPERVKKLLSNLPKNFPFLITVKTANGPSPRKYENKISDLPIAEGTVQLSDSWLGCVFRDGTMYFAGGLEQNRIINNSNPIALRLPKLPQNFIYTDFGISGNTLYVAWEENSFYKTGRAGLLSVDLGKILYGE